MASLIATIAITVDGIARAGDIFAARTLRPGTILAVSDLKVTEQAQPVADAYVGLETRRAIYTGQPVSRSDLGPPTLVKRNEIVVMSFRQNGLQIRTEGRSLGSGGQGETVDVMNLSSRQTIRAVVTGTRRVEVRR